MHLKRELKDYIFAYAGLISHQDASKKRIESSLLEGFLSFFDKDASKKRIERRFTRSTTVARSLYDASKKRIESSVKIYDQESEPANRIQVDSYSLMHLKRELKAHYASDHQ